MSDRLQIPHSLTTVADAVSIHLERFKQSCPNDFYFHRQRKGGIEYFQIQLAPVIQVGFLPRQLDLGCITLRRLEKNLTELALQDSKQLDEGPDLFLGVKMLFSDEEVDYDRQLSFEEEKARAATRFERFKARHDGARDAVMQGLKTDQLLLGEERRTAPKIVERYVDKSRIAQLRQIRSTKFDLRRLIRLCEELNYCSASGSFWAIAALVRAVIDHVPPIFGAATFSEVANNVVGKSDKKSLLRLQTASRDISDAVLHQRIRSREVLPTAIQVDFKNELDVLLSEIVRRLG
jgi:hypothetical protein